MKTTSQALRACLSAALVAGVCLLSVPAVAHMPESCRPLLAAMSKAAKDAEPVIKIAQAAMVGAEKNQSQQNLALTLVASGLATKEWARVVGAQSAFIKCVVKGGQ